METTPGGGRELFGLPYGPAGSDRFSRNEQRQAPSFWRSSFGCLEGGGCVVPVRRDGNPAYGQSNDDPPKAGVAHQIRYGSRRQGAGKGARTTEEILMRFGFPIPTRGSMGSLETIRRLGRAADEYEYDSAWITDHIVLPRTTKSKYPYSADGSLDLEAAQHYLDALTVLSYLAGVTERVALGSSVL